MRTPEKLPANKGAQTARTSQPSAMTPATAARGPMTPEAVVTLQRAVGHQAVSRMLAQEPETPETTPAEILDAAMSSGSRPIESGALKKAQSFYQNDRLSQGRVHTGPLAQRAVAAFGAKAMTVGTHIFFGANTEHDPETAGHEYGHLDKNTRGIAETGTDTGTGAPVTDPGQHSEREAATDGAAFANGTDLAPSVAPSVTTTAQRAVTQSLGATVQRMEDPARHRRHRRRSPNYEADVSSESAASSPERRGRLQEQIDQELAGGPDMGELVDRLGRMEQPGFRRVRAIPEAEQAHPDQAGARYPAHPASESSEDAAASSAAEEHELPEDEHLTELRDLLMKELHRGDDRKKLKVTFKVIAPSNDVWGGHAWIEIRSSKGKKVSFGFYPTGGGDYQQIGSVQGGVKCPDWYANRPETARETKEVRLKDIIRGYHLVHSRSEANYNFTIHNCTTFASDVWTAMTGKSLPRNWSALGLLGSVVSTPSGAAEGLGTRQERRHQSRHPRMHGLASGPARGVIPGGGTADEVAERLTRAHISQSSSSQSEDVD